MENQSSSSWVNFSLPQSHGTHVKSMIWKSDNYFYGRYDYYCSFVNMGYYFLWDLEETYFQAFYAFYIGWITEARLGKCI